MADNNKNTQDEFFKSLEEAQKEYEELNQITDLCDLFSEVQIEDYSRRNFSPPIQLVIN